MNEIEKLPSQKLNLAKQKYYKTYKLDLNINEDPYPDARLSRLMDYTTNFKNIRWEGERHTTAQITMVQKYKTMIKSKKTTQPAEMGEFR